MEQQDAQTPTIQRLHSSLNDDMDTTNEPMAQDSSNDEMTYPLPSDDTETDEDVMTLGSPPARVYTPPPHIAARFYRSSAPQRRKSSAASSRRNSISSIHSKSSHGYGMASTSNTPQSKHVAQHLRRASILADRKARLADRAAHAEQVRLRAALAKAAVRDISISEERAQAAAQTREKNLAEIAATCAEEVKRAKAVAESIKEKREQELQRLRKQIQVRLDEAERRREELRRNNAGRTRTRGHSATSNTKQVEVMPQLREDKENTNQDHEQASEEEEEQTTDQPTALSEEEAAFKILEWWRTNHRRKVITAFQQLGLAVDSIRDTKLETVLELLSRNEVLETTGKVLRLCGIQEGKARSVKEIVVVRTFLSAFVILGHPTQVLGGGKERHLSADGTITMAGNASASSASDSANSSTGTAAAVFSQPKAKGRQEQVGSSALSLFTSSSTDQELQELVGKARDLLICFETILSRLTMINDPTPPPSLTSELVDAYDAFHDAFIAWKARDASAMVDLMVKQFVELDGIWASIKDSTDPHVTDTYRKSIRENQVQLMVRIKQLAGPKEGKKKVFDAVHKARKAKEEAKKKAAAENSNMKPREADSTIETAMGDLTNDRAAEQAQSGAGGAGGAGSGTGPSVAVSAAAPTAAATATATAASSSSPTTAVSLTSSSPEDALRTVLQPDERYSNSPLPENRVVIHELSINRKYRISPSEFQRQQAEWIAPIFRQMRKTMTSTNELEREEHFFYLVVVSNAIRSKLLRLTVPGKKMHQFISELLDTEVAQQQYRMGTFSYERFFASVGQLLPKLCAPIRDDEVKELVDKKLKEGDYVDRLQALEAFVDVMLTDHVNFMISVAAPQLLLSATKYETTRFAELVNKEGLPLTAARAAWASARSKVLAEASKRDPDGINHPRARPTPDQFYTRMLVDVFTQFSPIPKVDMPEMLLLDHARAQRWGAVTRRIVTGGAILLQAKNLLKRDVRVPWKTEAHRILTVLDKAEKEVTNSYTTVAAVPASKLSLSSSSISSSSSAPSSSAPADLQAALNSSNVVDGIMAALESGRSMPAPTKTQLRAIVQRTLAAAGKAAAARTSDPTVRGDVVPQEPVVRLLLHRLRGYLVARLGAASTAEKTRQNNTVGERLTSLGLAEFVDRVREMVDEMSRVATIDRETHGAFWETVDAEIATESET